MTPASGYSLQRHDGLFACCLEMHRRLAICEESYWTPQTIVVFSLICILPYLFLLLIWRHRIFLWD